MSPFRSEKQRRYLFARHPKLAHRWAAKYGTAPKPAKPARPKPPAALEAARAVRRRVGR